MKQQLRAQEYVGGTRARHQASSPTKAAASRGRPGRMRESWFLVGNAQIFFISLYILAQAATQLRGSCGVENDFNSRACAPLPKVVRVLAGWITLVATPMLAFCAGHSWQSELAVGPKRMVARRICLGVVVYCVLNSLASVRGDARTGAGFDLERSLLRAFPYMEPFRPVDTLWFLIAVLACKLWMIPLQHVNAVWLCLAAHVFSIGGAGSAGSAGRTHDAGSAVFALLPFFAVGFSCTADHLRFLHGPGQRAGGLFATAAALGVLYFFDESEMLRGVMDFGLHRPVLMAAEWIAGLACLTLLPPYSLRVCGASVSEWGYRMMPMFLMQHWVYFGVNAIKPHGVLNYQATSWPLVTAATAVVLAVLLTVNVQKDRLSCLRKRVASSWMWQNDLWWPRDRQLVAGGTGFETGGAGEFEASPDEMMDPFAVPKSVRCRSVQMLLSSSAFQQLSSWALVVAWMVALVFAGDRVAAPIEAPQLQSCESMGGIVHPRMSNVCCAESCGVIGCGAPNCTMYPGGARGCCVGSIFSTCGEPPCRFGQPESGFLWKAIHSAEYPTMSNAEKAVACAAMSGKPHAEKPEVCCAEHCGSCEVVCDPNHLNPDGSTGFDPGCCALSFQNKSCGSPPCLFQAGVRAKKAARASNCLKGHLSPSSPICCAESCGACGGTGCAKRPGGWGQCCGKGIRASSRRCAESENTGPCIDA